MVAKGGVERAESAVETARETVARWTAEQASRSAELADMESRVGDEVLAYPATAARLIAELAGLRAAVEVAGRASVAAAAQLVAAERLLVEARATALRAEADGLRRDAERRQQVTDGLLAQLADFEGCRYAPYSTPNGAELARLGEPVEYGRPLTGQLLGRASALDDQAASMLAQPAVVPAPV